MEDAARLLQLVVNGAAAGCIYGLIALGFVLIYKATEMINFAQGDIMMLGGFFAFALITHFGLNYWVGALLAIALTAAFGFALDAVILRRVIGQPQFAVVMLTLGLGFIFRAAAGITWGYDSVGFETPFTNRTIKLGRARARRRTMSRSSSAPCCCAACCICSSAAPGSASRCRRRRKISLPPITWASRCARVFSLIWAISAGVAAVAGILLSPVSMIDVNMGFLGIKAFAAAVLGGFGSIPGALVGGVIVGIVEQMAGYYLPAGFQEVTSNVVLLATLILRPQGLFAETLGKRVWRMRYLFRTDYGRTPALWRHRGDLFWYGLLGIVLLVIPFVLGEFYVGEMGGVFIFAIAGVGLMLLIGYTGLISLGHAAFLGIGAYTNAILLTPACRSLSRCRRPA